MSYQTTSRVLFLLAFTWPAFLVAGIALVINGWALGSGLLGYCASSSIGLIRVVPYLSELWDENT